LRNVCALHNDKAACSENGQQAFSGYPLFRPKILKSFAFQDGSDGTHLEV
jgi:hypothetical protein